MIVQLTVKYKIRGYSNTHDGYCSGNECEYADIDDEEKFTVWFELCEFGDFLTECGKALPLIPEKVANEWFWRQIEEITKSQCTGGSGFCSNSEYGEENNIGVHSSEVSLSDFSIHFFRTQDTHC